MMIAMIGNITKNVKYDYYINNHVVVVITVIFIHYYNDI